MTSIEAVRLTIVVPTQACTSDVVMVVLVAGTDGVERSCRPQEVGLEDCKEVAENEEELLSQSPLLHPPV